METNQPTFPEPWWAHGTDPYDISIAGYELARMVLTLDAYLGGDVSQFRTLLPKAKAIISRVKGEI